MENTEGVERRQLRSRSTETHTLRGREPNGDRSRLVNCVVDRSLMQLTQSNLHIVHRR